jgi:hypothetical protein
MTRFAARAAKHIWGGGMHHDALLSSYGRGKSLVKLFSFGHNWVIVCLCVRTPWNENRSMLDKQVSARIIVLGPLLAYNASLRSAGLCSLVGEIYAVLG